VPIQQQPIATWSPARDVWETDQVCICGHSDVFSETFPTSGTWAGGMAYALPTSVPRMDASGSSSLRGSLLPTPSANVAENGGSQHPDKRRAGGHQPSIADVVEHL